MQSLGSIYVCSGDDSAAVGLTRLGVDRKRKENGAGEAVRSPELET